MDNKLEALGKLVLGLFREQRVKSDLWCSVREHNFAFQFRSILKLYASGTAFWIQKNIPPALGRPIQEMKESHLTPEWT